MSATQQVSYTAQKNIEDVLNSLHKKYPEQKIFLQAAREVLESLTLIIDQTPRYRQHKIIERIVEPERVYMFKVPWLDDKGEIQVNMGYRVQFSSAIGPYKGGLRFHPSVGLDILKFLGFEQIFKNSLTGLPMGGGKGGSDFDPTGKTDWEVMKFCQSFMQKLYKHIGPDTDVPAGDIGVGAREIGFLFGQYKKLVNAHESVLTGKGTNWGGSLIRPEATGYGATYFLNEMLKTRGESLDGKKIMISGCGNVATFAMEKVTKLGGKIVSFSEEDGCVICPTGFTKEQLAFVKEFKGANARVLLDKEGFVNRFKNCTFYKGQQPWGIIPADVAFPCATQNEISLDQVKTMVNNGLVAINEGANMPTQPDAVEYALHHNILFGPGKAANAGGVATSGLEMSQNAMKLSWSSDQVKEKLQDIMVSIHQNCVETAAQYGAPGNYVAGANIAGFKKVADAMCDLGI